VPGQPGKAFGADCEVVPAVRPSVITEGTWLVRRPGAPPLAEFTLVSRRLSAEGTWDEASSLGVCITCVPGQVVTPRLVFDQPTPMTDVSFARGEATVGGTTFELVEFGGSLVFDADAITIPTAPREFRPNSSASPRRSRCLET
jgi:hypothetical protein